MADAMVERRPAARFFCHRCNVEFEDVLQDYVCPYCASGFIEQLETDLDSPMLPGDDVSDADMSNLDESDDFHENVSHPVLNDLAFLMSGGRLRGSGRPETILEQLVWTLTGGAAGGATTAGAPLVFVGAPGDYVVGGEGLDAVVTQLLGQLENLGPPPLPRDQIAAIPREDVTSELAAANVTCSVCWDPFKLDEKVSRLECEHVFHSPCIEPWLRLHATCPICRRSLLAEREGSAAGPEGAPPPAPANAPAPARDQPHATLSIPRLVVRRMQTRGPQMMHTWGGAPRTGGNGSNSTTSMSTASSVSAAGVWASTTPPSTTSPSTTASAAASVSVSSPPSGASLEPGDEGASDHSYNMDIDFD